MKDLAIYLNDHLAGSVGALELLDDLIDTHQDDGLAPFLQKLRAEITADQQELQQLMQHFGIEESKVRKAGAWMAEKFSRIKLRVGDSGEPNLALFQSLESLSLGIMGKRSLWRMLDAAARGTPRLAQFDFPRLEKRALDQFEEVQRRLAEIAAKIFPADLHDT